MQKKDKSKLNLFLVGLRARMQQNRDYFSDIEMTFVSGRKQFRAAVTLEGEGYRTDYNGQQNVTDAQGVCDLFSAEAEKFDSAALNYRERGYEIVIDVTARGVSMKQGERKAAAKKTVNPLLGGREYLIPIDGAEALLKEIGILTAQGKLKNDMVRKYNQIDHYVELVAPMFEKETEEILLLDCACGKSYLSFVMNYYLRDVLKKRCRIIGIDYNQHVVEESAKMAKRLGYHNMQFIQADLRKYEPPEHVTAVISLHACDIATDLALGTAIKAKAKYIACVPCCHKELLSQYHLDTLEPILQHGVFRARMNDILTDGLRALKLEAEGYQVSVVEYISPLDSPKNLLIRATRTAQSNDRAAQQYQAITSMIGTYSELDRRCDGVICDYDEDDWFFTNED